MLTLRPYQQAAIKSIYEYYEEKQGNCCVVLPTAAGKSLVAAAFIEGVLKSWPDQRILIVTHVRELIAQNHAEMIGLWPDAPAGIYSAGLGKREAQARILFAGIQSIHRRAQEVGHTDLVLIDEAHLIPGNSSTMYRRFLDGLARINPALKVIGLTATPFRLDSGMLHEGRSALFTDIAYEAPVRDLIDAGYLSPLVSKQPATRLDVSKVGTRAGDFIQRDLAAAVDKEAITRGAVTEIIEHGRERQSWLAFCSGVEHARHVAEEFGRQGITCRTIFGDTPKEERDAIIAAFKRGEIRALASMGVLTTGFNAPAVDLIALLRPTKSAGLYVQMVGRGTRLAPGKENCLVLDFAGNVRRHGPIDLVRPRRPGEAGGGEAPTKVCPECDSIIALSATECPDCGYVFPAREVKIAPTAATLPVLSPKAQWLPVQGVSYSRHDKLGGLAIATVAASIQEFGWRQPIVVDEAMVVLAGHTRLEAARKLGFKTAPVHVAKGLTVSQARAFRIMDNRSSENAEWDKDLLNLELADLLEADFNLGLTGFTEDELNALMSSLEEGTGPQEGEDDVPETPEDPISRPGDLWILGSHRLLCGDSTVATDVERLLGTVKPLLMVTDPPYGVEYDPGWRNQAGAAKTKRTGKVLNDDRADWREAWALFPGDVAYVWHGALHAATVAESLEVAGFTIRSQIIWAKDRLVLSRGDYHWQHEPAWYAVRKSGKGHWAGDRKQTTLWQIANKDQDEKTVHGTQKPVECMRRPILNNSSPGQAVYEPFMGSGTTLIAAETTERVCYGIELNPAYVDVAVQRWQNFTGKQAVLDGAGTAFDDLKAGRPTGGGQSRPICEPAPTP